MCSYDDSNKAKVYDPECHADKFDPACGGYVVEWRKYEDVLYDRDQHIDRIKDLEAENARFRKALEELRDEPFMDPEGNRHIAKVALEGRGR